MPRPILIKSKKIAIIICVVILVIAVSIFAATRDNKAPVKPEQVSLRQFSSNGVSFKYPEEYVQQPKPKSQQANQARTIAKLAKGDPLSIIEVAKETGAIAGANSTHTNFLDFLERNATISLPTRYKVYRLQQATRISIAGHDASVIAFTYTGTDDKTTLYMHFFIIPVGNDAYYATIQSSDQNKANSDAQSFQNSLQITK